MSNKEKLQRAEREVLLRGPRFARLIIGKRFALAGAHLSAIAVAFGGLAQAEELAIPGVRKAFDDTLNLVDNVWHYVENGIPSAALEAYVKLLTNLPKAHQEAFFSIEQCDPGSRGGTMECDCDDYARALELFKSVASA